jgi:hypothetical protein
MCINYGEIYGAYAVGGICGDINRNSKITICANYGNIFLKDTTNCGGGGIAGGSGWSGAVEVSNCYNSGNITADNAHEMYIGGIIAGAYRGQDYEDGKTNCYSCYNVGILTNDNSYRNGGVIGRENYGVSESVQQYNVIENNFWLETCGAEYGVGRFKYYNEGAEPKTETIMKMQAFVDLLNSSNTETVWVQDTNNINNGYPIFKWQITGSETTQIWVANSDNTEFTYGSGKTAITVKIGDYIDYTANPVNYSSPKGTYISNSYASASKDALSYGTGYSTDQNFSSYDGGWRVLGVENGALQLISADSIISSYYLRGYTGATYGEEELNNICSKYGNSTYTSSARSVNVDDINKITGYNPNNVGVKDITQSGIGTEYGNGYIYAYGNEVTYAWGNSNSSVNGTGTKQTCTYSNGNYGTYGFNYYNNIAMTGINWLTSTYSNGTTIATLKSTFYSYYPYTLTAFDSTSGDVVGISTTSNAYKMLFRNSENTSNANYWLASSYILANVNDGVTFGVRRVYIKHVDGNNLVNSIGGIYSSDGLGVRPVITLKSGVTISNEGDKTGESQEEAYKLVLLAE